MSNHRACCIRACQFAALIYASCFPFELFAQTAQQHTDDVAAICCREQEKDTVVIGRFTFKTYENDEGDPPACLQIFHDDKVVFREAESAEHYYLGQPAQPKWKIPSIKNGTDLTGRGNPDVVVSQWSGGAHCCSKHYVFELEPELRLIASIDDQNDDLAHFENANGEYIYKTEDATFQYWPSCFACSPFEPVVLRFHDQGKAGAFHLALDQMRRPAPTPAEWKENLGEVRRVLAEENPSDEIGRTLWQFVLHLIYSGHSDLAWKFVDEAGPKAEAGNLPDLGDFCSHLKASPYWLDIQPTLVNTPPACADAKPKKRR